MSNSVPYWHDDRYEYCRGVVLFGHCCGRIVVALLNLHFPGSRDPRRFLAAWTLQLHGFVNVLVGEHPFNLAWRIWVGRHLADAKLAIGPEKRCQVDGTLDDSRPVCRGRSDDVCFQKRPASEKRIVCPSAM